MKIVATNSGAVNLLALINETNSSSIGADQITFGLPVAVTGQTYNTDVVVTGVDAKGITGTKTVHFIRLAPAAVRPWLATSIDVAYDATVETITSAIISTFGLRADNVDVTGTLPAQGSSGDFTITAKSDSFLYVGSSVITVNVATNVVTADAAIPNATLTGFEAEVQ